MNHIRPLWLLTGLLMAPSTFAAETNADSAQQYSHAMPVTVNGKDALVQLRLPKDVYLGAQSAELADLRLFDGRGAKVPYALIIPEAEAKISVRTVPATIFPLMAERRAGAANAGLDIRTSPDGSLVSVHTRVTGNAPASGQLAALVLDMGVAAGAGQPPAQLSALRLSLPKDVSNYTARVELEVSDDLKQWDSLGESVVSWLTNADTKALANDRIEFEPRAFRYARLSWRDGAPVAFSAIVAEVRSRTAVAVPLESMTLTPQPGKFVGDLRYPAAIAMPVRSFALQFAQQNVVMPAAVGHYVEIPSIKKGQPNSWKFQPSFGATFYQITQSGRTRRSGDLDLNDAHAAEWVLRPQTTLASPPSLRVSWQPATLVFLANGNGPYTLAVGRTGVPPVRVDISKVAPGFSSQELVALEQASVGPATQQRGAASASSTAALAGTSAQGRQMILWGVLGFGLIVLGAMTKVLLGQMRNTNPESIG